MKKIMPIFIITVYALLCMSCFCCVFVPNIRVKNSTKDTILVSALWKKGKMNETCIRLEPDRVIYIAYGKGSVLFDPNDSDDDEEHTIYLNEVEEDWDLDKYRGIGWDTQDDI